jgi:hypothetical protein
VAGARRDIHKGSFDIQFLLFQSGNQQAPPDRSSSKNSGSIVGQWAIGHHDQYDMVCPKSQSVKSALADPVAAVTAAAVESL